MKLSVKQVSASVTGALAAALILSYLGVQGTIVGVALGSVAATVGSALAFNSLERGHEKVMEIVGSPIASTGARSGEVSGPGVSDQTSTLITEEVHDPWARPVPGDAGAFDAGTPQARSESPLPSAAQGGEMDRTTEVPIPVVGSAPLSVAPLSVAPAPVASSGTRWPVIAVIALVFAVSLGTITVVELLVGKPLSAVVDNGHGSGNSTSVGGVFGGGGSPTPTTTHPSPATTTVPTTTVPPTTTTSTTTSTTAPVTTTTTTVPPTTSAP